MTRDSAAVAALDDRRHHRCPASAAPNAVPPPDDDASPSTANGVATSGSSSNGGGDRSTPKSSSTSTGSSSSRSGSDDDDSGAAVVRPSDALPTPPLHKGAPAAGDRESSGCSNGDGAPTADTSSSIGGRLTFYKGKPSPPQGFRSFSVSNPSRDIASVILLIQHNLTLPLPVRFAAYCTPKASNLLI